MELRRALAESGYRVYGWNLGVNTGADIFDLILQRIDEIYDDRPIVLVGWSLGGLFARELARAVPDKIRAVVTLGSPISGDLKHNNVWRLYEWITGHKVDQAPVKRQEEKPPVPSLAIWSNKDGLIPAESARGSILNRDVEFEVPCTHMALGMSFKWTRVIVKAINEFLDKV
jgi:pimeloyl-ACP methyl ester carboxylesterase